MTEVVLATKEWLANLLNGRTYGHEITAEEESHAKEAGLVVLFGASDDLAEFRGAIQEETGAYDTGDGHEILLVDGAVFEEPDCDCQWAEAALKAAVDRSSMITAHYGGGRGWRYETDIPHATFDVTEEGELYCRGIVFELKAVE